MRLRSGLQPLAIDGILSPNVVTTRRSTLVIGKPLFREGDLSNYLRAQEGAIESHVRTTVTKSDLSKSDAEIIAGMMPGARVNPIAISFDAVQKSVAEARIAVNDHFSGRVQIDGVRATRTFPFSGDAKLFDLRPNQWTTVLPYAEVRSGQVVIGFEGRADDPESLRQELDRQEKYLSDYVEWSTKQVGEHNVRLEAMLGEAVARRRQHLSSLDDLASRI